MLSILSSTAGRGEDLPIPGLEKTKQAKILITLPKDHVKNQSTPLLEASVLGIFALLELMSCHCSCSTHPPLVKTGTVYIIGARFIVSFSDFLSYSLISLSLRCGMPLLALMM